MRVFMTGGTGVVGSGLAQALVDRGDQVVVLSRAMRAGPDGMEFVGGRSTDVGPWTERLAGCDAVVHLAGEPIARWRWTDAHERRIARSRVEGTRILVAALAEVPVDLRPRALVAANSVDVYPFDDEETRYAEDAALGAHVLAEMCLRWQEAAEDARALGLRVVVFRAGMVIGRGAHMFTQLVSPYKLVFRGPVGTGEQWLSWVHIDDVVGAYLAALDGALDGVYNLVAPGAIRQGDFARAVAAVLHREPWRQLSAATMRQHLGPFADYLLGGRRSVALALEDAGFRFRRWDAPAALAASLDGRQALPGDL